MKSGFKTSVLSILLLFSSLVNYTFSSRCEASVIEQLCSSVTNFLNDEAAKTDADLKACKDKCGWKKRKDDLLDAARKKAKESCSKGEAPDVTELSKGLDRNTKDRLKDLYDRNSRMFDGTAKLEAANFGAVSSKDAALTGKGGQVTDLKSAEPATPKLNAVSEFSLAKTSNILASAKTALLPQKVQAAKRCEKDSAFCPGQKPCQEDKKCESVMGDGYWPNDCEHVKYCGTSDDGEKKKCIAAGKDWVNNACVIKCTGGQIRNAAGNCECPKGNYWDGKTCTKQPDCICSNKQNLGPYPPVVCTEKCNNLFPHEPPEPPLPDEAKSKGRPLTSEEMKWVQEVFGNSIAPVTLSKIRLKTLENMTLKEREDYKKKGYTGKTSGYTIYIPKYDPNNLSHRAIFIHEMTHVYQSAYFPLDLALGKLADWWKQLEIKLGRWTLKDAEDPKFYKDEDLIKIPFGAFGLEQQAEIVKNYYETPMLIADIRDQVKKGKLTPAEGERQINALRIKEQNIKKLLENEFWGL